MTKDEFDLWLLDESARKAVLVEVGAFNGVEEVTLYLATAGYNTLENEVPSATSYLPVITDVAPVRESLSLSGTASLSAGEIEFSNHEGDLDPWLTWVFDNRPVSVYFGDLSWPRDQFIQVFSGVATTLELDGPDSLKLPITDKLQRLNSPISDKLDDSNTPLPIALGEVSNISPTLVDPVNLVYQVNARSIGGIIEVRDRGLPVQFSQDTAAGTFRLGARPFGEVTCSVWGDAGATGNSYVDTIAPLITRLATEFGPTPLSADEIDHGNLAEFSAANHQCVGAYFDERENLLNVMSLLANSVGAAVGTSATGKLQLHQLREPSTEKAVAVFSEFNMEENSFRVLQKVERATALKLAFNRNYTPGQELSAGVPSEHQRELQDEWKFVSSSSTELSRLYRKADEPEPVETALQVKQEAHAECDRRLRVFSDKQRYIYTFTGFAECLTLELGQDVIVNYPRYGFEQGAPGLVVGVSKDWLGQMVEVEIFV